MRRGRVNWWGEDEEILLQIMLRCNPMPMGVVCDLDHGTRSFGLT